MDEAMMLVSALAEAAKGVVTDLVRARVPLLLGVLSACIAAGVFAVFLRHRAIGSFFSSATGVSVGLLISLIVNGLASVQRDPRVQQMRAGTVTLASIAAFSGLTGQLVTGSAAARGLLFALTWGGMIAGLLGLVFFVRVQSELPPVVADPLVRDRLLQALDEQLRRVEGGPPAGA